MVMRQNSKGSKKEIDEVNKKITHVDETTIPGAWPAVSPWVQDTLAAVDDVHVYDRRLAITIGDALGCEGSHEKAPRKKPTELRVGAVVEHHHEGMRSCARLSRVVTLYGIDIPANLQW